MKVVIQGCCHGSLTAIYDSIAEYERQKGGQVDLLLLCGDFQALRSQADFASLAVPPKYHALGTFHQYYSGERVAPVLTIVIGGNHEASNYMWELYHGGWLAPNIYYLGAAGSVLVDGLRIAGASGIYKSHDYNKGHFENVPFNNSTLRSVYHIRQYDVAKLMLLPRAQPTVFLSHDWPISIARHGDTKSLLKRKPYFRGEIDNNTLGSPPLFGLLNRLRPDFWFAAHLHVKFAAVYEHPKDVVDHTPQALPAQPQRETALPVNPDEISISDDEDFDAPTSATATAPQAPELPTQAAPSAPTRNPDEINLDDDEDEDDEAAVEDVVADAPKEAPVNPEEIQISDDEFEAPPRAPPAPIPQPQPQAAAAVPYPTTSTSGAERTHFLALDKCGPGKDFIQFLDIPAPEPSPEGHPPRLTFDPHWLAISRALHPFLSTELRQPHLPLPDVQAAMVAEELERIRREGVLVPGPLDPNMDISEPPPLVWERGPVDVGRVQQFWPTAPPEGHPGGSPTAWYTNPQTEAFCGMLGLENKVNPRPPM